VARKASVTTGMMEELAVDYVGPQVPGWSGRYRDCLIPGTIKACDAYNVWDFPVLSRLDQCRSQLGWWVK
jgi:hypothetical protein